MCIVVIGAFRALGALLSAQTEKKPAQPAQAAVSYFCQMGLLFTLVTLTYAQIAPTFPQVVWKPGDTLYNAWAGGLHAPQFSTIDLTADGQPELIVFDRMDNRLLVFEKQGLHWRYRPEFSFYFYFFLRPHHWMLLRDYDGDGDKDLFTASPNGPNICVYRNINPIGSPPIWELTYAPLQSTYYGYTSALFSNAVNIPGITDIDGDGDVDFLVYEVLGNFIEWHRNKAIELLGRPDALILELASECWGHIAERYDHSTNEFYFVDYICGPDQRQLRPQCHQEGSLLPIQLNGDTLIDIIVGDFLPPYLIAGYNTGTRTIAHIDPATAQAPYPLFAPAVMPDFPAAYYEDVTGDGKPDLLVANNDGLDGTDRHSVWLYPNVGRVDSPAWAPPIIGWLHNTMIDIGTGAHPTFADLNRDGYPDLILTCRQTYTPTAPITQAWLFWGGPSGFTLADSNWLNLPQFANLIAPIFTTGDIDGNGRLDLLMGTSTGAIWRWEETSPASTNFQLLSQSFLSVSSEAAPLLYDIDNDGDLDLLVGTRNGRLALFTNQSGAFQLLTDYLGQIEVRDTLISTHHLGYARPALLPIPGFGTLLLVGNITGFLHIYLPDWSIPTAAWPLMGDLSGLTQRGTFTSPSIWAFNDSTWLAIGLRQGGVILYRLDGYGTSSASPPQAPAHTYCLTRTETGFYLHTTTPLTLTLLTPLGQTLWETTCSQPTFFEKPHTPGLYLLRITDKDHISTHRLLWP